MAATHPSWSAYVHGCRCDDCRAVAREYQRDYLERKRTNQPTTWESRPEPPIVTDCGAANHHTAYSRGCRCDACRRVLRDYHRDRRARERGLALMRIAEVVGRD